MAIQEKIPQAMEEVRNQKTTRGCNIFTDRTLVLRTHSPVLAVGLKEKKNEMWQLRRSENFFKQPWSSSVEKCQWLHGGKKKPGASFILIQTLTHTHTYAHSTYTQKHIRTHIKTFSADEALSCLFKRSVTLYVSLWWVCALQLHTHN